MIRAALKSLLGRKVRLLLSTFAIVLGVSFVAGSLIFSATLNQSFTALFASTVGDVVVSPEGNDVGRGPGVTTQTLPASLGDTLRTAPGAARVDGKIGALGVFVIGRDDKVIGGLGPPSIGANWSDAPAGNGLRGLVIEQGHEPEGRDEVVLDSRTADLGGYELGDRVPLVTSGDTLKLRPTLVGIAGFADGGSLNGATLAAFDTATAQDLFLDGEDAYSDYWVTAEDGVSQAELAKQVQALLPDRVEAVTGDRAADENASGLVDGIGIVTTFLLIFAGIALVVGAFLIVNTFSILVAQRSRELALLRALGASKRQVAWSVQLEAFVLGALGATLGLGLGLLLAMGIRAITATFGLDLTGQPLVFEPSTAVTAYVIGIAVTMAAAWLPSRRTGRIAPVQALRDDVALPETSIRRRLVGGSALVLAGVAVLGLGLFASVPLAGWCVGGGMLAILLGVAATSPTLSRPLLLASRAAYARAFGTMGNLAGQNSLRNLRRTTATASALMIGLTLAFTMAILGDSAKASVDQKVEENFIGDYIVSSAFGGPFSPRIAEQMAGVDGVSSILRERFGFGTYDGDTQGLAATDPDQVDAFELSMARGRAGDLRDSTALVEEGWADDEGVGVGDEVDVEMPTGTQRLRVVGVFEENPLVFFPILTTLDTLTDSGYPDQDNYVVVNAEPGASGLQARLDAIVAASPVVTVKDQQQFAAEQRQPIDQIVYTIFALLGLALVIAVLGIVNTLALSVIERTREIGLLRALGVSRRQLRLMIRLESVVIALLGAVLGVVLGTAFGVALMYAVRDQGLEVISIPVGQLLVFLVLALVIGVLAAVLPARRAARLDVLRAIATE